MRAIKSTSYNLEEDTKNIAQARSWWNTHYMDVKVLEQIQKLNPTKQPTLLQLASPLIAIGRFNVKVPDEMNLNYREQSIYGLNINTVPLPEDGIAAAWAKQMQEISAIKPPEGIKQALVKEFELLPGVKAAWYRDNAYYPKSRMLVVMQQWDNHILVAQRDAQEGKEEIAEELMSSIIQSYQANQSKGFGVGDGAILEGPSLSESTRLYLKHKGGKDIAIHYNTLTVHEKSYTKEKDLDEEKGFAKATGSKLKVLKKQKRAIAGIKGKEIWVSMSTPKEGTFIRFSWDFIGVSRDATKPSISISLKTTESDLKVLEGIWEQLLNSITARPLAEKK